MVLQEVVKKRQNELVEWVDLVFRSGTVFKRNLKEVVKEEVFLPFWAVCFQMEVEDVDEIKKKLHNSSERELLERLTEGLVDYVIKQFEVGKVLEERKLSEDEAISIIKGWMLAVLIIFLEVYSFILGACMTHSGEDLYHKTKNLMIGDFLSVKKH